MIGCESLVFMSLLEFTLAQFLQRRNESPKGSPKTIMRSKIEVEPKKQHFFEPVKFIVDHFVQKIRFFRKVVSICGAILTEISCP